jgi:TetR/AcrR family transcriptional regulator
VLRESRMRDGHVCVDAESGAALMLSLIEGRMHQFLRTRFKVSPAAGWEAQWAILERALFQPSG